MRGAEVKTAVIQRVKIRTKSPQLLDSALDGVRLDALGIDSMGIISLLVELEKEMGLDFERVAGATPPRTVADVVGLALRGCGVED